jgi:hypothetical protein
VCTDRTTTYIKEVLIQEKRQIGRFPWVADMTALLAEGLESTFVVFRGVTENVGEGGVAVLSSRAVAPDTVLRCAFPLSNGHAIPTLMKVRWSTRANGQFRLGLQFLL